MQLTGICSICGGVANPARTCALCGRLVCGRCIAGKGVCRDCVTGRKV